MFSLIRKDFLIQKNQFLLYVVIVTFFAFLDKAPIVIGFIFSLSFIMNANLYDEKDNSNLLLNSLPYTRNEIVASKYIGALFFAMVFAVVIYIGSLLLHGSEGVSWKEPLLIVGLIMLTMSFLLPFLYKFKMQYLHYVMGAAVSIYVLTISFIIKDLHDRVRELTMKIMSLQEVQLYILSAVAITGLYTASWLLSIRIYNRKAF